MLERMWRNRNLFTLLVGVEIHSSIVKDSVVIRTKIPFDSAIPVLGIYPKDYKSFCYKDTCTHTFIAALSTIEKTWNQPRCPSVVDWIKKMWHIYIVEYYAAIKSGDHEVRSLRPA